MHHVAYAPLTTTLFVYIVIAALLIYRFSRPRRISLTRMWLAPALTVLLSVASIWTEHRLVSIPIELTTIAIILGLLCGIPLGLLRGKHTNVRATDRPGIMYLDSSWIVLAIWLGAFVLRAVLRIVFSHGTFSFVFGDGLLAFAVSTVATSYYVIYTKYRALEISAGQIS